MSKIVSFYVKYLYCIEKRLDNLCLLIVFYIRTKSFRETLAVSPENKNAAANADRRCGNVILCKEVTEIG